MPEKCTNYVKGLWNDYVDCPIVKKQSVPQEKSVSDTAPTPVVNNDKYVSSPKSEECYVKGLWNDYVDCPIVKKQSVPQEKSVSDTAPTPVVNNDKYVIAPKPEICSMYIKGLWQDYVDVKCSTVNEQSVLKK